MIVPARCGTTIPIELPERGGDNSSSPPLVGTDLDATGIFAFAWDGQNRLTYPVLSSVIHKGPANTTGGGLSNLTIEGADIPQGFGYYRLYPASNGTYIAPPAPNGYAGPTDHALIPRSGNVVSILAGKLMQIDRIHASNALGSGNAVISFGLDEEFPVGLAPTTSGMPLVVNNPQLPNPGGHVGNLVFTNSRIDANDQLSGSTNADFAVRMMDDTHDSTSRNIIAFDGTKADVLQYNGNLWLQLHVNSDAGNSNTGLAGDLMLSAGQRLAGVADHGFLAMGNTSLSQAQIDIANLAAVRIGVRDYSLDNNPAQLTDIQVKCGNLSSVQPTFYGVRLSAGARATTVSGTAANTRCNVPADNLIVLDGPLARSVSLCNNSNSPLDFCGPSTRFAIGRVYTRPASATTTATAATGSLYAMPFVSPVGGMTASLGVNVTSAGAAGTTCRLAIYSAIESLAASTGQPGLKLYESGPVDASAVGAVQVSASYLLIPNRLYYLAVGCGGSATLPVLTGSANTASLTSLFARTTNIDVSTSGWQRSWTYSTAPDALPASFLSGGSPAAAATVPNIYIRG